MKNNSEGVEQKFFLISRRLSVYSLISFLLSGVFSLIIGYLESRFVWLLEWKWLLEDILLRGLLTSSFLAIVVDLVIPSLLIFVFPALSFAWLRGGFRGFSKYKLWKEVSNGVAILTLLTSIFYFLIGMTIFYMLVINGWFGQPLITMVTSIKLLLSKWWSGIVYN